MGHKKRLRRSNYRGLTLIEILIAIIILLLGLVGILALFPAGIKSTNESVDKRMASLVADSVEQGLLISLRSATPENVKSGKPAHVKFYHDGLPEPMKLYEFNLPLSVDPPTSVRYFVYTPNGVTQISQAEKSDFYQEKVNKVFTLGSDLYLKSRYETVITERDPTDPYSQWGYIFTVSREDDSRPPSETGDNFKPRPLYDFEICIYRVPKMPTTTTGYASEVKPRLINTFAVRLIGQ